MAEPLQVLGGILARELERIDARSEAGELSAQDLEKLEAIAKVLKLHPDAVRKEEPETAALGLEAALEQLK